MLELEKFYRLFSLTFITNFFLFSLSYLFLNYSVALQDLLKNTFLSDFGLLQNIVVIIVFAILKWLTAIFMVGAIIGLLTIFFIENFTGKNKYLEIH